MSLDSNATLPKLSKVVHGVVPLHVSVSRDMICDSFRGKFSPWYLWIGIQVQSN